MLSRAYRHAAADQRRRARKAAVAGDVTGDQVVDDAALSWLFGMTTVLLLLTAALFALGGYQAVSHSARSVPLLIVGGLFLAAAVRSGVKLAGLRRRRRRGLGGHPCRPA
jgi:hypothetical protein